MLMVCSITYHNATHDKKYAMEHAVDVPVKKMSQLKKLQKKKG